MMHKKFLKEWKVRSERKMSNVYILLFHCFKMFLYTIMSLYVIVYLFFCLYVSLT